MSSVKYTSVPRGAKYFVVDADELAALLAAFLARAGNRLRGLPPTGWKLAKEQPESGKILLVNE